MSDDVLKRLDCAYENHPNADPKRLLWLTDADPSHLEATEAIVSGDDPPEPDSVDEVSDEHDREPSWRFWADVDFATPMAGVWLTGLLEREQWMGHAEKKPFAPWSTRDPPVKCRNDDCPAERADDDACGCDGRFKRGYRSHSSNNLFNRTDFEQKVEDEFEDKELVEASKGFGETLTGTLGEDELDDEELLERFVNLILQITPHDTVVRTFKQTREEAQTGTLELDELNELIRA